MSGRSRPLGQPSPGSSRRTGERARETVRLRLEVRPGGSAPETFGPAGPGAEPGAVAAGSREDQ